MRGGGVPVVDFRRGTDLCCRSPLYLWGELVGARSVDLHFQLLPKQESGGETTTVGRFLSLLRSVLVSYAITYYFCGEALRNEEHAFAALVARLTRDKQSLSSKEALNFPYSSAAPHQRRWGRPGLTPGRK